jgi:hypothetical protein
MHGHAPFAVESALSPKLAAVMDYWRGLRRGEADIPFADDLDPGQAQALCDDIFVLGVFEHPERFRLDLASTPHAPEMEAELQGSFLDELELVAPLDYARAQADAAVESRAPTWYRRGPSGSGRGYARLLLPLWGEGQVRLLLGAIEWL